MNSAPRSTKSAATDTSAEMRKSAEWTALRAITVSSPATSAASAKTQKKTLSQPCKTIVLSFELPRLAPLLKHLAVPDEAGARVGRQLELLRQLQAGRGARLLAERAEHAARGVEDELVEHLLLARLAADRHLDVHRDDVDAVLGARERAEVAGDAQRLVRLGVHVQPRRAVEARRDLRAHRRVLLGVDAEAAHRVLVRQRAEVELQRQPHPLEHIRHEEALHLLLQGRTRNFD